MQNNELIISVSGMRGVVGRAFTLEAAIRYVLAFDRVIPPGPICVGTDSRPSGSLFEEVACAALKSCGRPVIRLGKMPTPTLGVVIRALRASGGVMISASHNPPEYNGLKLFSAEGRIIPSTIGAEVLRRYHEGPQPECHLTDPLRFWGQDQFSPMALMYHLQAVLQTVEATRIRARRFRVVLDCNHGVGGTLGRRLLEELGCEVIVIGETPDGNFAHIPEPLAENVSSVLPFVRDREADIGFCQDPDADRLAIIDHTGRYLGEEYTLALCLDHVLRHRKGPVVINCATSLTSERIAQIHGAPCYRTPVGEAHVVDGMLAQSAIFGGEGNGGPIDPRVGLVRDSFVGMALVLDAMAERNAAVAELADQLPRFCMLKTKVPLAPSALPRKFDELEAAFPDAHSDRTDGLRLSWPDRWLVFRGSNTEPIVRLLAEAPTQSELDELCQKAMSIIR